MIAMAPETVGVDNACGRISIVTSKTTLPASIAWILALLSVMDGKASPRLSQLGECLSWVRPTQRGRQPFDEARVEGADSVRHNEGVNVPADEPCPEERAKMDRFR